MDWTTAVVVAVVAVAAYPYLRDLIREKTLTSEERSAAPGNSVTLRDGTVHYRQCGPPDAPPIVMVHGFSVPMFVFEQNADALQEAGFRVILFDHFGRGWSDRPSAAYDTDFYDRELLDLLDALGLDRPVGLVGYSMGGIISAEFAARHPERVSGLFLIAPAGLAVNLFDRGFFVRLLRVPVIGDWIWRLYGRALVADDPQLTADRDQPPERRIQGDISKQMTYRGYLPAILSTWRHLPMCDRDETFGKAAAGTPIMAVFGGKDPTIDPTSIERMRRVAPDARIEVVASADHSLAYRMFDTVNPLLIDFFSSLQR